MEIALQGESRGIVYEGYDKAFIQCIFEEGGVQGRNERYEFRCDSHLQCCGRVCCIPEEATIPLWLMIIFVVLALLLLLAILGTLAWLCAKKFKNRPKKQHGAYTSLNVNGDEKDRSHLVQEQETYSTPEPMYSGYNRAYSRDGSRYGRGGAEADRYGAGGAGGGRYGDRYGADYNRGLEAAHKELAQIEEQRRARELLNERDRMRGARRDSASSDGSVRVHETFEETFKQEITYERAASTDSREML